MSEGSNTIAFKSLYIFSKHKLLTQAISVRGVGDGGGGWWWSGVVVSLQAVGAAEDVQQRDGRPRQRHAVLAEARARRLRTRAHLLAVLADGVM